MCFCARAFMYFFFIVCVPEYISPHSSFVSFLLFVSLFSNINNVFQGHFFWCRNSPENIVLSNVVWRAKNDQIHPIHPNVRITFTLIAYTAFATPHSIVRLFILNLLCNFQRGNDKSYELCWQQNINILNGQNFDIVVCINKRMPFDAFSAGSSDNNNRSMCSV